MSRATTADVALLAGVREWLEPLYASLLADGEDANAAWGPFGFACSPPIACALGALAFALGRPNEAIRHCERAVALTDRAHARAHRAWVELTSGEGLDALGDVRAAAHLKLAVDLAMELGMPEVQARAQALLDRAQPAPRAAEAEPTRGVARSSTRAFTMCREGAEWRIEVAGRSFRLKDVRGLAMIARVVENPGREIHSLDLAGDLAPADGAVVDLGDCGEVIDRRAADAYRKRLSELREDLDEAERFADSGRVERLRPEIEALTEQLAAALGLGGRERRTGSAAERARVTVQRRIREAIRKIGEHDPNLGRHLDWTVRTGTFCAYEPDGRKSGR